MKTPRELIVARHQSAEAKLKAIRADTLAACARSAAVSSSDRESSRLAAHRNGPGESGSQIIAKPWHYAWIAVKSFWQATFWPWRRAWIGIAAVWFFILAFGLAARDTPRTASAAPSRLDPEVMAILKEQKQLLTQLLGPGAPPLVSHLRTPGPRSAVQPPNRRAEEARSLETTLCAEAFSNV